MTANLLPVRLLLVTLEHETGDLARGAVHPHAGKVAAPAHRAGLQVSEIMEGLPAEEVLPRVGDTTLNFRLAGGVRRQRGIDEEATVLGVLEEHAIEAGGIAVGPGDGRREIVDDQAADDAAEEQPGRLQAVEDRR